MGQGEINDRTLDEVHQLCQQHQTLKHLFFSFKFFWSLQAVNCFTLECTTYKLDTNLSQVKYCLWFFNGFF
jgi:hypothetical protein